MIRLVTFQADVIHPLPATRWNLVVIGKVIAVFSEVKPCLSTFVNCDMHQNLPATHDCCGV